MAKVRAPPKGRDLPADFQPKKVIFAILLKNGEKLTPDTLFPFSQVTLAKRSAGTGIPIPDPSRGHRNRSRAFIRLKTNRAEVLPQRPGRNVSGIPYRWPSHMRRTGDRYGPLAL